MKRHPLCVCVPLLLLAAGCDAKESAAANDEPAAAARAGSDVAEKSEAGSARAVDGDAEMGAAEPAEAEPKADPVPDGLDPNLDHSGLDETGVAIARLYDAAKTCAFDMNSQIRGCKPWDEFRRMERAVSPMTKAFADQRDRVTFTRLKSEHPTVRALSYNYSRGEYRDQTDRRAAIEEALAAESDTVALLVGLRAMRDHIKANPSLVPVFEKHAASSEKEVAETAQKALDKAAN